MHSEIVANFERFKNKIVEYRISISDFLTHLFGSGKRFDPNGLKTQLNCRFVGDEIRKLNRSLCA